MAGGPIQFKLPAPNALAGKVLAHSIQSVEALLSRHDPCIFKVGITRDPLWRWKNDIYGYAYSRDKWSNMTVIAASPEPLGPSMLEAALIERFQSALP